MNRFAKEIAAAVALLALGGCGSGESIVAKVGSASLCPNGWTGYNSANSPATTRPEAYYENSGLVFTAGCPNDLEVFTANFGPISPTAGSTAPCSDIDVNFVLSNGSSDSLDPPETTSGTVTLTESSGNYFATGSCTASGQDDSGTSVTATIEFKDIPFSPTG